MPVIGKSSVPKGQMPDPRALIRASCHANAARHAAVAVNLAMGGRGLGYADLPKLKAESGI